MTTIKWKRLKAGAQLPKKSTSGAAGFDCYLPETFPPLGHGEVRIVPLGFSVEIPEGYAMRLVPRSGLASKGLLIPNSPALIDSDYRGEVGVILVSIGGVFPLNVGDRICQMTFEQVPDVSFEIVDEISETERGEGGFGHSGGHSSL